MLAASAIAVTNFIVVVKLFLKVTLLIIMFVDYSDESCSLNTPQCFEIRSDRAYITSK